MPTPIFDHHQEYQLQAIQAVTQVCANLSGLYDHSLSSDSCLNQHGSIFSNVASGYSLELNREVFRQNLLRCQTAHEIPSHHRHAEDELVTDVGTPIKHAIAEGEKTVEYPHFCVEMETGTGKTYVYLRSMMELHQKYGFHKFVIVVPSIAIFEGVRSSIRELNPEFQQLYDEQIHIVDFRESEVETSVRDFTEHPGLAALLITPASFNKKGNRIFKMMETGNDGGYPYQVFAQTRPIIMIDEPQTVLGGQTLSALRIFNPLLAFRFSATHRDAPNLIYRLTPFDAFNLNLVKQVEVIGFDHNTDLNGAFLHLLETFDEDGIWRAIVQVKRIRNGLAESAKLTVSVGTNIHTLTNNPDYENNFIVTHVDIINNTIQFENGMAFSLDDYVLGNKQALFEVQIRETIRVHMQRYSELRARGIKVLSLFFIDKVANYIGGDAQEIDIPALFDRIFNEEKIQYPLFQNLQPTEVREAYFAQMDTGEPVDIDQMGNNARTRAAKKQAYERIMRRKYDMVSFTGELRNISFIFAHSALREGWDNPNVFQICTLNTSRNEIRKRQELGRGLRLPLIMGGVAPGGRCKDPKVNVLTVIANQNYQQFAKELQLEYTDGQPPSIRNRRQERTTSRRQKEIFNTPIFRKSIQQLLREYTFDYDIDTPELIRQAKHAMEAAGFNFPSPLIQVGAARMNIQQFELRMINIADNVAQIQIIQGSRQQVRSYDLSIQSNEERSLAELLENSPFSNVQGFNGFYVETFGEQTLGDFSTRNYLRFSNGISIAKDDLTNGETDHRPYQLSLNIEAVEQNPQAYQPVDENHIQHPIPDFLSRLSKELRLSKRTIWTIFENLSLQQRECLFRNPEGFIKVFRNTIQECLADQIALSIKFIPSDNQSPPDLKKYFPKRIEVLRKRSHEAKERSLYTHIQIDSDEESDFVDNCLERDDEMQAFFKLPHNMRFQMPKFIGSYNPDWAIIRNGQLMIRETKGTDTFTHLWHRSEQRKIICGMKLFQALGISYRFLSADQIEYWEEGQSLDIIVTRFRDMITPDA